MATAAQRNYFDGVVDGIIKREGGYVDHPSDRGGPTNRGITEAVARANRWKGSMRDLPEALARTIYLGRFITVPKFDKVHAISEAVGAELIDTGVLMGPGVASMFFQQWLNGFNLRGKLYPDLFADGRIGTVTLDSFRAYMEKRGEEAEQVMVEALNCSQGERMLHIAQGNESQEDFLYGWVRGRVLHPADEA